MVSVVLFKISSPGGINELVILGEGWPAESAMIYENKTVSRCAPACCAGC